MDGKVGGDEPARHAAIELKLVVAGRSPIWDEQLQPFPPLQIAHFELVRATEKLLWKITERGVQLIPIPRPVEQPVHIWRSGENLSGEIDRGGAFRGGQRPVLPGPLPCVICRIPDP